MTGKMWTNRGFGQEAGNVHNPTTRQSRRPHIVSHREDPVYKRLAKVIHRTSTPLNNNNIKRYR